MKICQLCNSSFKTWGVIDGKKRNFARRKYCLNCSPFGGHNTRLLSQDTNGKKCPKCKITKLITEFYKRRKNQKCSAYCKTCTNNQTIERQRKLKIQAILYLGGKCVDCGYNKHPCAFDFHHLEPDKKNFSIGQAKLTSFEKIKEELDKCILLCAICHRIRHINGTLDEI